MSEEQLRLQVNAYDLAELEELLSGSGDLQEEDERPEGAHGEPVTIAIMVITPLVVQAISLWLMKRRHKESVEIAGEKVKADGSREIFSLKMHMSESTPLKEVVEQLVTGFQLDPSLIEAATRATGGMTG